MYDADLVLLLAHFMKQVCKFSKMNIEIHEPCYVKILTKSIKKTQKNKCMAEI